MNLIDLHTRKLCYSLWYMPECIPLQQVTSRRSGVLFVVRSSVNSYTTCDFFFLLKSFLESRSEYPKHLLHNPLLKQNAKKKILLAISILFSAKYRSQLQRFYRFSFMCFIAHVLLIYYNFFPVVWRFGVKHILDSNELQTSQRQHLYAHD